MSDSKKFYSFYPENNILLLNNHFWTSWYPQDERKTSKHLYLTSKRLQESSEMCRNIIDKVVRFSGIGQSSAETLLCSLSVFADMFALFFFIFSLSVSVSLSTLEKRLNVCSIENECPCMCQWSSPRTVRIRCKTNKKYRLVTNILADGITVQRILWRLLVTRKCKNMWNSIVEYFSLVCYWYW